MLPFWNLIYSFQNCTSKTVNDLIAPNGGETLGGGGGGGYAAQAACSVYTALPVGVAGHDEASAGWSELCTTYTTTAQFDSCMNMGMYHAGKGRGRGLPDTQTGPGHVT